MKKGALRIAFYIVLTAVSFLSCERDPTALSAPQSYHWEVSSPEAQGLDSTVLEEAYRQAQQSGFVYSVLIIRNGYMVGERYFQGYNSGTAANIMSVSKSFISALVGLALREGFLDSLNQPMIDFFPDYDSPELDPDKRQITIGHLLKMRAGFDPSIEDYDQNFYNWITSDDWIRFIINWPLRDEPGTRFAYITAETHLLSAILTRASGMTTMEFARKYLFQPLRISIRNWDRDPAGYYVGGMGMYMTPRDMARLGYLYLRNGRLADQQIVPEEWVSESLQPYSTSSSPWGDLNHIGYGYQWWMGHLQGRWIFMGLGYGGQYIVVCPSLDLLVVTTANHRCDKYVADEQERAILSICSNYIFTAVLTHSPPF